MLHALRPYVTAGIALAGASVIAVTPIAAPPPPIAEHPAFSSVDLSAAVQPLDTQSTVEAWQNLFIFTGAFTSASLVPLVTNPTPVLNQVVANQFYYANLLMLGVSYGSASMVGVLAGIPGTFGTAFTQLRDGDPEAAILTLWDFVETSVQQVVTPFIPSLQIPMAITQNIANVAATIPMMTLGLGLDTFETVSNTVRTMAASVQDVVDAASSGDPTAVANAILVAPANIATALLVGDLAEGGDTPGLINGVFKNMVLARQTIAEALGAEPLEPPEDELTARSATTNRVLQVTSERSTDTEVSDISAPADSPAAPKKAVKLRAAAPKVDPTETAKPGATKANPVKAVRAGIGHAAKKAPGGLSVKKSEAPKTKSARK